MIQSPEIPIVTIAIPTRNRSERSAASTSAGALAQTYPAVEVLVSDNASTDDTSVALEPFKHRGVRVLRQASDVGMIGNWNVCLASARGEYFTLLSDDDWLEPTFVEVLLQAFSDRRSAFSWSSTNIHGLSTIPEITHNLGPLVESGLDFLSAIPKAWTTGCVPLQHALSHGRNSKYRGIPRHVSSCRRRSNVDATGVASGREDSSHPRGAFKLHSPSGQSLKHARSCTRR